jgi:uncharacterized membrane protein
MYINKRRINMNTQKSMTQTTVIFAALAAAGISIAVSAQVVPDDFAQTVMVSVGSAIFGAGLTFFLVRMNALLGK